MRLPPNLRTVLRSQRQGNVRTERKDVKTCTYANVIIIGISLDGATKGGLTKKDVSFFVDSIKVNFPVVHGTRKTMRDYGGITTIPAYFIIDKDGNITAHHQGPIDKIKITSEINSALSGVSGEDKLIAPDFSLQQVNQGN